MNKLKCKYLCIRKFNALINQQVGTTIKQSKEIISNLKGEKALRQSALIQHQKGLMTLNAEQKKAFEDEVRRLTQRINLEKLNGQELLKTLSLTFILEGYLRLILIRYVLQDQG